MKKLIYSRSNANDDSLLERVECLMLVNDALQESPRRSLVFAAKKEYHDKYFYMGLTRNQLLQLPKRELESLKDVEILRKLNKGDLTPDQARILYQANRDKFITKKPQVIDALNKIQACEHVRMNMFPNTLDFYNQIIKRGGQVTDSDVKTIVDTLTLENYYRSTFSTLDKNWNSLLMIFGYEGMYTFPPKEDNGNSVTISHLDLYIKIDIDSISGSGYGVMSFHNPKYEMTDFPYRDNHR